MEVHMKGPGEITVSLVDRAGRTLGQQTIRVSGSARVEAKMRMSLVLRTKSGEVEVAPVLVKRSANQQVTFDATAAGDFTQRRCREIGCTAKATADAAKGIAKPVDRAKVRASGMRVRAPES